MKINLLFMILSLSPRPLSNDFLNEFIVWNIGQGSASTLVTGSTCLHIDMGGESWPTEIDHYCRRRQNQIWLTHFDWDHINLIGKAKIKWKKVCLNTPQPAFLAKKKQLSLSGVAACAHPSPLVRKVFNGALERSNESHIYVVAGKILITGDAPAAEEARFISSIAPKAEVLLLGHHGSRSSSSARLLKQLPKVRLSIVSARKKRYGHPHPEVVERLRKAAVPWVSTEGYGHVHLILDNL